MIVSPGSAHSFWILLVRNNIAVIREFNLADGTDAVLLDDFPIHQFPHLAGRAQFPVSARVMGIVHALHSQACEPGLGQPLPATAGQRIVDWTEFVATESQGSSPVVRWG